MSVLLCTVTFLRESCSQFDSLPLTSLTISTCDCSITLPDLSTRSDGQGRAGSVSSPPLSGSLPRLRALPTLSPTSTSAPRSPANAQWSTSPHGAARRRSVCTGDPAALVAADLEAQERVVSVWGGSSTDSTPTSLGSRSQPRTIAPPSAYTAALSAGGRADVRGSRRSNPFPAFRDDAAASACVAKSKPMRARRRSRSVRLTRVPGIAPLATPLSARGAVTNPFGAFRDGAKQTPTLTATKPAVRAACTLSPGVVGGTAERAAAVGLQSQSETRTTALQRGEWRRSKTAPPLSARGRAVNPFAALRDDKKPERRTSPPQRQHRSASPVQNTGASPLPRSKPSLCERRGLAQVMLAPPNAASDASSGAAAAGTSVASFGRMCISSLSTSSLSPSSAQASGTHSGTAGSAFGALALREGRAREETSDTSLGGAPSVVRSVLSTIASPQTSAGTGKEAKRRSSSARFQRTPMLAPIAAPLSARGAPTSPVGTTWPDRDRRKSFVSFTNAMSALEVVERDLENENESRVPGVKRSVKQ